MLKRVNNGPFDDPDEYWFECEDCEGTGMVHDSDPINSTLGTCPVCGGSGFIEGDETDV